MNTNLNLFSVCLNSTAEVGPGSTIQVTIESSDNAYGTFQFAEDSLIIEVPEAQVGFSAANLEVCTSGLLNNCVDTNLCC